MSEKGKNYLGKGILLKDIFYYYVPSRPRTITPEKLPTNEYLQNCFDCFDANEYDKCERCIKQIFYIALCFCKLDEDKFKKELKDHDKITYSLAMELKEHHGLVVYNGLSVFFEYTYGYTFGTFRCKRDENDLIWFYKVPTGNEEADNDDSWLKDAREFFTKMTESDEYINIQLRDCIYDTHNTMFDYWTMENCNYY